ncbi:MAG: Indole-3-glycerol phosphate synthase, partial [Phenylobacterium sp.]|nr:Indole-3-glycerol phosphate synthase [Phenylobacterium sp.]
MSDILAKIAAYKREEVVQRKASRGLGDLDAEIRLATPPRGFR